MEVLLSANKERWYYSMCRYLYIHYSINYKKRSLTQTNLTTSVPIFVVRNGICNQIRYIGLSSIDKFKFLGWSTESPEDIKLRKLTSDGCFGQILKISNGQFQVWYKCSDNPIWSGKTKYQNYDNDASNLLMSIMFFL